jgi:hypothetical protein
METEKDFERGRKLLKELLPWARAEAKKGAELTMTSALGQSAGSYIREDRLRAVMIYPAPKGGWHADVVLENLPPGVPNTFGTRVEAPCRTRAEAEETAKRILVALLGAAELNRGKAERPPVFMLDKWSIALRPEIYDAALALMPHMANGYGSPLQAAVRVEETLADLCPEGFDGKAFGGWPHAKKVELVTVLHIAALSGLYTWPWRRDAPPMDDPNV